MEQQPPVTEQYPRLLGGHPALDYVNTPDPRGQNPREYLLGFPDIVNWARFADILPDEVALPLLRAAEQHPARAAAVYTRAIDLRETLHRAFLAFAHGAKPAQDDLDTIQATYRDALGHARLVATEGRYEWDWIEDGEALERPLWPIVRAAVDLLTSSEVARVKECGNHGCGWLFLDTSKNGRRRWCSMEGCGSQVKMRRYYARRRAATQAN